MTLDPTPRRPETRAASPRLVVAAALLSGALASGGTAALLLAAFPGGGATTSPATSAAPAAAATPGAAMAATATPPAVVPASTVRDVGDAIAAVAAATEPSVVTIAATGFGPGASAGGSGIVVSGDGLILTTTVVAPADAAYGIILADTTEGTAQVVATDAEHGLVLLRTDLEGLVPARLAPLADLAVGQRVIAIGSPLGEYTDTVTAGIVSSLERAIDLRDPATGRRVVLEGLIQTDAAINAGSSGGPLLDIRGAVVGVIATSAGSGEGIGFAIPIDAAADILGEAGA